MQYTSKNACFVISPNFTALTYRKIKFSFVHMNEPRAFLNIIICVVIPFYFGGCASAGYYDGVHASLIESENRARSIKQGDSKEKVLQLLGTPEKRSTDGDVLVHRYSLYSFTSNFGESTRATLGISFGSSDEFVARRRLHQDVYVVRFRNGRVVSSVWLGYDDKTQNGLMRIRNKQ